MKTEENKITRSLSIPIKIMLGAIVLFETFRTVAGFVNINHDRYYNPWGFVTNCFILVSVLLIFIFTIKNRKHAPLFWFVVFVFNILSLLQFLPIVAAGNTEFYFGLSVEFVCVYFVIELLLTIIIGIYAWSLRLPNETQKRETAKKSKDFESFLSEHK